MEQWTVNDASKASVEGKNQWLVENLNINNFILVILMKAFISTEEKANIYL